MMSRNVNSLLRSTGLAAKRRISNGKIFKFRTMSMSTDTAADVDAMKSKLNYLIASTARGTNDNNKQEITVIVESFEASKIQKQSIFQLQDLMGTWELLYTNDDITR